MSRIETEIWEPHPEKKGMVRYVGQRETETVFQELETFLREENLYPDEYLSMDVHFRDRYPLFPKMRDITCYTQWGGSEGVYFEVDLLIRDAANNKIESVHFVTGKTLDESQEAYDRMQYIAGCIYKAFMGEGFVSSRYIILKNKDEEKSITHEALTAKLEQECKDMMRNRLLHQRESLSEIAGELGLTLQILDVLREPQVFESLSMNKRKELFETEDILHRLYLKMEHLRGADRFAIEDMIAWQPTLLTEDRETPDLSLSLPEGAYYGFTCYSRMHYRAAVQIDMLDEITFGIYVRGEGCVSEATIGWKRVGAAPTFFVRAYSDGLQAAYSQKFQAVVNELKIDEHFTPEEVSNYLISEGFEDCSDEPLRKDKKTELE